MVSFGPLGASSVSGVVATLCWLFGYIGDVTALVLFVSAVPNIVAIWKRGGVEAESALMYIATFISCFIWAIYGGVLEPKSAPVILINLLGVFVELGYTVIYIHFAAGVVRRSTTYMLVAGVILVTAVATVVLLLLPETERRITAFGVIGAISSAVMYATPLYSMGWAIHDGNVLVVFWPLAVASLANAICWVIYASAPFDPYIFFPNLIGVVCAGAQVGVYVHYNNAQAGNANNNVVE